MENLSQIELNEIASRIKRAELDESQMPVQLSWRLARSLLDMAERWMEDGKSIEELETEIAEKEKEIEIIKGERDGLKFDLDSAKTKIQKLESQLAKHNYKKGKR